MNALVLHKSFSRAKGRKMKNPFSFNPLGLYLIFNEIERVLHQWQQWSNGFKLKESRFGLDFREKFFSGW